MLKTFCLLALAGAIAACLVGLLTWLAWGFFWSTVLFAALVVVVFATACIVVYWVHDLVVEWRAWRSLG